MREVRQALLEADVHYKVVREFCEQVRAEGRRRRGHQEPAPRPGDGQDRPRRTGRPDGPGGHAHLLRQPAADDHHDGRPPGLRQDHHLRQAGQADACARASSPLLVACDLQRPAAVDQLAIWPSRSACPASSAWTARRTPSRSPARASSGPRANGQRRGHHRHRRPAAHRRGDDEAGRGHRPRRQAAPDLPRLRRHDRPGRRQLRQASSTSGWSWTA